MSKVVKRYMEQVKQRAWFVTTKRQYASQEEAEAALVKAGGRV